MKLNKIRIPCALIAILFSSLFTGCGKTASPTAPGPGLLPLVTPLISAATPTGLKGSSGVISSSSLIPELSMSTALLSISDFKSRFFSGQGPTQILAVLLPALDTLINGINTQAASTSAPCLTQTPISFTITPFGQTIPMYAQCYNQLTSSFAGDPGFVQFGIQSGVNYIYAAKGAEWIAAVVAPIAGVTGKYIVQAWLGLGYGNTSGCSTTWDGCSYGAMELSANTNTNTFEFAVAGMGFGYCGAQLKSDGSNIYTLASADMGTTCSALQSLCVSAGDATTPSTCAAPLTTFTLTPIGRQTVPSTAPVVNGNWAVSQYPAAAPYLLFNGTSSDSIHFGPTGPTSGAGNLMASAAAH